MKKWQSGRITSSMTYGDNARVQVKGLEKIYANEDFRWDMCEKITEIKLKCELDEDDNDCLVAYITFKVSSINHVTQYIEVKFKNVSSMNLDGYGVHNQLLGFEIIDCSARGWQSDVRYFVNDYENSLLSFYCSDIEVVDRQ